MILGIDIGKKYGLCKLRHGEYPETSFIDKEYLADEIYKIDASYENVLVLYERVNANPRFGVKSCFTFGYELGWLEALLTRAGLSRREVVSPVQWKNRLNVHSKQEAIRFVEARWDLNLIIPAGSRVPNHNMADAVCIAWFGSLKWEGYL